MYEYHIDCIILLIERSVYDIPVGGSKAEQRVLYKRQIRAVNLIGNQKLGLVKRYVVTARNLLDAYSVVVPGTCILELVTELMDFSSCYELSLHPCA